MESVVSAAQWVFGKALAPFTANLLEDWAASKDLSTNADNLKDELLLVQIMLNGTHGKEIKDPKMEELLQKLQDLAYDADDVLDELEYFRIQDELDGTSETADQHGKGWAHDLVRNAFHTAKAFGQQVGLPVWSSTAAVRGGKRKAEETSDQDGGEADGRMRKRACIDNRVVGQCPPSSSLPPVHDNVQDQTMPERECLKETPKLVFNRVDVSKRMKLIVNKLRPLRQEASKMLRTLGSSWNNAPNIAQRRPATISKSIEPKLYGRDPIMKTVIYDITQGKYCGEDLTVIPIVGPGGIGKTTFAQHIYHNQEVQKHFQVKAWICVSLNFNADKLTKKIEKVIPKVEDENHGTAEELIGQRLKSKRFLLILDDIWKDCNEDEWKKVLLPFKQSQVKGNIIIVTTRFTALAQMVKTAHNSIGLEGLNNEDFKEFFLALVFGDEQSRKDQEFLLETGYKIAGRLKGSPLAAKTVSRLLRNHLDTDHWSRVLESKEWEQQNEENDIMPALKLSYYYLPFNLQRCFSYCALFPEDYKFGRDELIHLWIGLDILHSHCENKRIEDIGLSHLAELVNHGFLRKEEEGGQTCYMIHDLLHELALNVSSRECLSIYSSNLGSVQVLPSIRHLSINVDDMSVKDKLSFDTCSKDLSTLDKRLNVENLHSLMLFGEHHGSFVKTFGSLFKEAKALRVLFLSKASYNVEDLLPNFFKLIHLRYLRIRSDHFFESKLPNNISILYHLKVLDLQRCKAQNVLPRGITNLIKLRHLLVQNNEMHSNIFEVGKLKWLQELRTFMVKKEIQGFELRQIGDLVELCGSLLIDNLEKVEVKEEADEAKLMQKCRLHELKLCWDIGRSTKDSTQDDQVLENLKPNSNLLKLSVRGHGGVTCPSWLGENLSVINMQSLHLEDVSWKKFPPLGGLLLVNEQGVEHWNCIPHNGFRNLRRLEFNRLPRLKKWVESGSCHLFPRLEVLIITHCFELTELSFSHSICCQRQKEAKMIWFPKLRELKIENCPKLLSFPPVPCTSALCSAMIKGVGLGFEKLVCGENYASELSLEIKGKDDLDSTVWNLLVFDNPTELKELKMDRCPPLPLQHHFQMLSSLRTLTIRNSSNIVIPLVEGEGCAEYQFPIECLTIDAWGASSKELTHLLTYFPKLPELNVWSCNKITGLGVMEKQATATPAPSPSANKVDVSQIQIEQHQQQDGTRGEEEIAAEEPLLLPSQLQKLEFEFCPELILCSIPVDYNTEAGKTGGGQGLQGLTSLRSLGIHGCPRFLSSYSSSSTSLCSPFPTSLEQLSLYDVEGMGTVLPLSNLNSLTDLSIWDCGDLRGEGLWPLLAQGRLTKLLVRDTLNFFAGSESSPPHEQEFPPSSSKLRGLQTGDVAGVLAAPICAFLSSSLTELFFYEVKYMERFTKEQEEGTGSSNIVDFM